MESKIRILLADSAEKFRSEFKFNLAQESDIELVGETGDGYELLNMVKQLRPDAIVMELVLDKMDGLTVLSELRRLANRPKILVLSSWGNMMDTAASMGADFFMTKPCCIGIVCQRLRQLLMAAEHSRAMPVRVQSSNLENQITSILLELGVPAHMRGFKFLRRAVVIVIENPQAMEGITKTLYPGVAKFFETSPSYIERGIRHAIESAWGRCDAETQKKYFGHTRAYERHKPTNSEFIAVICEYIMLHREYLKNA